MAKRLALKSSAQPWISFCDEAQLPEITIVIQSSPKIFDTHSLKFAINQCILKQKHEHACSKIYFCAAVRQEKY